MSMCGYARKHSTGIHSKASIRCKIIKYLFQIHTEYIPNESQTFSTFNQHPFQKWAGARCTGPVFSSTDDVFNATGDVFEASGRAAAPECQKGERVGSFWIPRGEPLWSKSAKKSPGVAQKDPKSRKMPSQNRCKTRCRKKIPNVYQKPSKMMPKRMPNSSICYAFAKKVETLQTVCFPIENVVLGIQELRKVRQKLMENQCLKKTCKK